MPVDSIAISNQEPWHLFERKGLDDLLRCPLSRRMGGDVKVHDLAAVLAKHNEREQDPERSRRNREEVDGDNVLDVVVEECTPSLRRWLLGTDSTVVDQCSFHSSEYRR